MVPSHSSQLLSPSPRFSPPCALSVSAFSPLASPFDFGLPTVNSLSPRSAHQYHSTALTHPLFSYSCALFCHNENDNLFAFRRFHTLCPKHPGWGAAIVIFFVAQISDLPVLPVTSNKSPVTSHQSRVTSHESLSPLQLCAFARFWREESALTKNQPLTRLESALPKRRT